MLDYCPFHSLIYTPNILNVERSNITISNIVKPNFFLNYQYHYLKYIIIINIVQRNCRDEKLRRCINNSTIPIKAKTRVTSESNMFQFRIFMIRLLSKSESID